MEYRIFREDRREVYRIKEKCWVRWNMFFGRKKETWRWVMRHGPFDNVYMREWKTRSEAEDWITEQTPDKWEEV